MLASQMIYTACGKDKSGAFSVWAKSVDVTKPECDEIIKLMSYRKPQNVPYEPTDEELKTLFPKKYGYFILSSGRKCIALTSYVGKVYSDMDARNGNFIIHAFVFKDLEGFNPFRFMKLNLFKTSLSYVEWHDNPAPDELPIIEVGADPSVDEEYIRNCLSGNNKSQYISLLQAVINSVNSDATVTFNDSEENQMKIYSLIGTMLPAITFNSASFSNQYSTQLDFTMSSSCTKPVKIRNIFSGMINSTYNYGEEIALGHYAFYFTKGQYSSVEPKRYLVDIVKSLESGSLFSVLKKISEVNKIMCETHSDIDTAIAVYYILQKKLDWFAGVDEYTKALDIALAHNYIEKKTIAFYLYNDIILTEKWGKGIQILPLIKFAYENNESAISDKIFYSFFNSLVTYGVNVSEKPVAVLNQIKTNAPFSWDEFVKKVIKDSKWESYIENKSTISELYFVFDGIVCAIEQRLEETEKKKAYALLLKIFKKALDRALFEDVKVYLENISKLGNSSVNYLVENALNGLINTRISSEVSMEFIMRVICLLSDETEKVKLFGTLILNNIQSSFILPLYIKYASQYQTLFAQIERTYENSSEFRQFQFKKEAYVFKNITNVTFNGLDSYFNKYYKTGFDSGVYLEKVKQYISAQIGKSKIAECMRIYNQVKDLENSFYDVVSILDYINREIFSLSMDELLNYTPSYLSDIIQLNTRLRAVKKTISDKYELLNSVLLLRSKTSTDKIIPLFQRNEFYSAMTSEQVDKLVLDYFNELLDAYIDISKKKCLTREQLLIAVFEKPLDNIKNYEKMVEFLDKYKCCYEVMADIMAYAFNINDRFASNLINFVNFYVESMKHGENKKLFKKVLEIISERDKPAVQKYIDKYLDEHMSFFEKLFNKKK